MSLPLLAYERVTKSTGKRERDIESTVEEYVKIKNLGKSERHFTVGEGERASFVR
jgi:hypothetical protein